MKQKRGVEKTNIIRLSHFNDKLLRLLGNNKKKG